MKENVQKKLAELRAAKEQTAANLNALSGAIQILEELLKEEQDGGTQNDHD